MNQINPLHIGTLLGVFILFLFFQLTSVKEELKEADKSYKVSEKLAVDLSSLKSVYADKKKSKVGIKHILNQPLIKQAKLTINMNKKSIYISSKSVSAKVLNSLMGKLLNSTYKITSLKIKKLDETKASLNMEVQL